MRIDGKDFAKLITRLGRVLVAAALFSGLSTGCTRIQTDRGLEPTWNDLSEDHFSIGVSTQSDVLAAIGPPSQIISGAQGEIFYYLHEKASGVGAIFIFYNEVEYSTRYDRAVFFFDSNGVLQDYSISKPQQ